MLRKGILFIVGLVLLISFYTLLKWLGITGTLFSDGHNTSSEVTFDAVGSEVAVEIKPSKLSIIRYRIRPVDQQSIENLKQVYQLTSHEQYCESGEVIGKATTMRSIETVIYEKYHPRSAYGKTVRPSFFRRSDDVCIYIKLDSLAPKNSSPPKFKVSVSNLRPCWGFECILD